MKVVAAEPANTIFSEIALAVDVVRFIVESRADGSRCLSLMVWLGNAAHPRLDLGSGRNACPSTFPGRALTQRLSHPSRKTLGSATFKIVAAPHMTPYMVSTGP